MPEMTRSRVAVAATLVLMALLAGCGTDAARIVDGAPAPTIPDTGAAGFASTGGWDDSPTTTVEPTTTIEPTTTTPGALADPDAAVERILLRASDVPSLDDTGLPVRKAEHTTDSCKYVSASPWLANTVGRKFTPDRDGLIFYTSQVAVEPTAADAEAIFAKADDDAFLQSCQLKSSHESLQTTLTETNAQTDCGMSITSEELTRLPTEELDPGVRGWQYRAVVHCAEYNEDNYYTDTTYSETSGPIAIQLMVVGYGEPDPSIVRSGLAAMLERAQQEQQG